ncbi:conserved hypothetical protein [Sporisorium reilianum SRZ2]|uniref:TRIP4/RQT4 C2HC5-type zinc finger domain-containing protein n=1 Tax=Sporisorium reilianum (strain SRZ2) TaxID=999809 RepID=E6ZZV6_SPORE|nr:conserved hypothetical protein [Sporisorium reilianum SRZ2]
MAKGSSIWIDQLVSLLGLDKETVKTQILPFLDSFDDEASLRTHLQGLVGTDTALAKTFVRDFTRSRFPQQASASESSTPTLPAAATPAAGAGHATGQKKRGKKTLAERAGIGQTLAPRKVADVEPDDEEQMAKLAEAFGGMGTVYRKKQGEDDFFAGTAKGKKVKQPGAKQALSGTSTPLPELDAEGASILDSLPIDASHAAPIINDEPSTSASASQAKSQPSPPPTAVMLAIDAVIEELTSTSASTSNSNSSSTTFNRKMCFCQGRRHALAPHAPLCYSCGLILCSAIQPSPLSPLSSCPSCSASPLLGAAARSDLVAKLSAEREILFEQQLLQIQLQREQKKLNKATARSALEEEAALFPRLGMEGVSAPTNVPHAGPVVGKHGALARAKTIASDAQRTAKVLSLDMKTHKVKTHTKVTRPKPAATKQEVAVAETEVVREEDSDPFVGLDGSLLVKNETDDGLRAEMNGQATARTKSTKAIPPRSWTFAGRQLTLRPTAAAVQ